MNATSTAAKFLIVIEDEFYRELITRQFRQYAGIDTIVLSDAQRLVNSGQTAPDFIVIDDRIAGGKIEELLMVIRLNFPTTSTVVLTADAGSSNKLTLMKLGASDVIPRDENTFELLACWTATMLQARFRTTLSDSSKRYTLSEIPSVGTPVSSSVLPPFYEQERTLEDYTMDIIQQYLAKYNYNVVLVARKLGVGKSTIYRYLKDNKLQLSGTPSTKNPVSTTAVSPYDDVATGWSGAVLTEKAPVATLTDTESLTDLRQLYTLYKGNRSAVAEMIDVFLRSSGHKIESLKRYQSAQDLTSIRKCLNELKPSVEYMGLQTLRSAIIQEKLMIDTHMDWKMINDSLTEIYSLYHRCAERLQEQRREIL